MTQSGCDTHVRDPLANLRCTVDGQRAAYRQLHELAHEVCGGRWVAVGGGGYDLVGVVPRSWTHLLAEAAGAALPAHTPQEWRDYVAEHAGGRAPTAFRDLSAWRGRGRPGQSLGARRTPRRCRVVHADAAVDAAITAPGGRCSLPTGCNRDTQQSAAPASADLAAHLVATHICGDVATSRQSNLTNARLCAEGHPGFTFGVEFRRPWTYPEVVAELAKRVGICPDLRLRVGPGPDRPPVVRRPARGHGRSAGDGRAAARAGAARHGSPDGGARCSPGGRGSTAGGGRGTALPGSRLVVPVARPGASPPLRRWGRDALRRRWPAAHSRPRADAGDARRDGTSGRAAARFWWLPTTAMRAPPGRPASIRSVSPTATTQRCSSPRRRARCGSPSRSMTTCNPTCMGRCRTTCCRSCNLVRFPPRSAP